MINFFAKSCKCSQDDAFKVLCSSEPVPSSSTGSEPVDNRPSTQEGKPTSQESASTSDLIEKATRHQ